jgi:gliding motility-associated-like protein
VYRKIWIILLLILFSQKIRASHVMGGEISWECNGAGQYVFQLVFYRDCNGAEVNVISENIGVWNHPSLTQITVNFISRIDISPTCTPVAGSPVPLDCGTGMGGGNGVGAIEKITYRSNPVSISGVPPASGWIFTYDNYSRSNALTNISNPSTYGITLAAKMFALPNSVAGTCLDNSPVFLQEPYMVSCAGTPYVYNMNPVDPDLDSLNVQFGIPYNYLNGGIYNLPSNPAPVPFEPGFSYTSPTPGTALNASNVPAQIDPTSGELKFTSFTTGNYVVKVLIRSFRNGTLIAEVERELQIAITACTGNNSPVIAPPFGGTSFETNVIAGTAVNFTLSSSDIENLQDGSPQSNFLTASGPMFGTNFTSTIGCAIAPCATLNATPLISGLQGVSTDFNWTTTCDHLVGADGNALDVVPYHFVFRIQDDYCQVPKVSYATVTINVINPGVISAPDITCIEGDNSGNVTINFTPVSDPGGTFVQYELHSLQAGLLTTSPALGTNSFTIPSGTAQDLYVGVVSGCNGNTTRFSDTLSNIFLTLNNPSNGTAILQWNDPSSTPTSSMGSYYYIMREYPAGSWIIIDSVPYGVNFYKDTIDICEAFLNYQIVLPNIPCDFTSNIEGDDFEDMMTPDIPVIQSASIDTLTGNLVLNWNENYQSDTYGYVVYTFDANGFIYELDTVWGISNTSYSYSPNIDNGPLSYSVAAFDSCWTPAVPPTYQTSAKATVHTTVFLQTTINICNTSVELSWSPYIGWSDDISYIIWMKQPGDSWSNVGSAETTSFSFKGNVLENYCFVIEAISASGISSFSNPVCTTITTASPPAFNYLQVATVLNDQVLLEHLIEATDAVQAISIQRQNAGGGFDELIVIPVSSNNISYTDSNVDPNSQSYTYRVQIIDSCGNYTSYSNYARTILLHVSKDDVRLTTQLNWSAYAQFDGSILGYTIYRGIDGNFNGLPLATVGPNVYFYEDTLEDVVFTGKVCYYVEAIEGSNRYDDSKISRSNVACEVFDPIVYIPNAFWPEGINKVFKPVISIYDASDCRFTVFDRWGQAIFNTTSFNEGWNGQLDNSGEMANSDTYVYMISFKDGNGIEIIKRGHVTLLR